MQLLDGKYLSNKLKKEIALEADVLFQKIGRRPHLTAILVGHDGASEVYIANKIKSCEEVGFKSTLYRYPNNVTEETLLTKIEAINEDITVDGILVQLPLPTHIDINKIIEKIVPEKDVDGFHPIHLGKILFNVGSYIPATPYGILLLLEEYQIETAGKHCVVVGRSRIVGGPMSMLMTRNAYPGNCTVTSCHSKSLDIKKLTLDADILIVAIGKKHFIKANMVKQGAVVIDVGMNREASTKKKSGYELYGDVDFDQVAPKTSWITPVPGGVGLMTIIGLLKNTLNAVKNKY